MDNQLLTDEQLEERARLMSLQVLGDKLGQFESVYRVRHMDTTLEALKVDRESLRLLEECRHSDMCDKMIPSMDGGIAYEDENEPCTCGTDTHIALLRSRLGITTNEK